MASCHIYISLMGLSLLFNDYLCRMSSNCEDKDIVLNNRKNKINLLKLMIISIIIIVVTFSLKSYFYYQDIKAEVISDAKREAYLLQDYMMSVRETFHKQFLASGIELNDKTLGFLPAHATTLISNKFQKKNDYNFYIRNVSDTPRNLVNMADKEEMKAIKYFKDKSKEFEYFKKYTENGNQYFQFASPIYIKQYCIACHGKREDALPTIRDKYEKAYNYKVGELRGIVSIKIPSKKINERFFNYLKKELLVTGFIFIFISIVFLVIFKKIFFQIKDIEKTAIDYASRDALTGLYNRKYLSIFNEHHKHFLGDYPDFVVAFLDIDYFKKVNDTYGHDMGDTVLKEFALLLTSLSRAEDLVCRYGGEEFLIIAYNISLKNAIKKFNNIRVEVENKSIEFDNKSINITISIGLAIGKVEDSVESIISNADKALYEAKENGRNRLEVFKI